MRPVRAALVTMGLLLSVAGCDYKLPPLTPQEQHIVSELTAHLTPRCVGRYLIDMPAEAREGGSAKIQGVYIEAQEMDEAAYRKEVGKREVELKGTQSIDAYPFLYVDENLRGQTAHYLVHRGTVHDDPATRQIEGYKWDRGYRFLLKTEAYDYTHPDQTNDPIVQTMSVKNSYLQKSSAVLTLLDKLQGRTPDEIPTEPGVCFAGGFLPGPAGDQEEVNAGFGFAQMRDVRFDLFTSPDYLDDTTIAKHADSAEARMALKVIDGHDIRKGAFDVSGMPATEWLLEGFKGEEGRGVDFSMALNEMSSKSQTPYFSLDLTTGGQYTENDHLVKLANGSLSPSEAVALWDAVSRTIRLRPRAM